ncbi:MAG TPA: tripartite tricarboxylate transporter permease [Streptosporangiaceae bacterium]|nr:tripartite tricarboxylate transporter permease [Streptosporangiaceae bacterium]
MSFIHASVQGLQALISLATLFGLIAGIAWGLLISFMPGVGGNVALALLLPLIYRFPLPVALALLFGTHISTYFGGSITSITLNIPASTKSLPLCWDGYPLARQGRGAYALRAAATAAGIGGVIGAIVLTLGIPVMRGMLNYLGPPEILLLAILGTILIAILSSGNLTKGLMAFGVGILLAWVGQDPITGIDRLTFGSNYLATGIQLADVAIGLFAVVQVIRLLTGQGGAPATGTARTGRAASAPGASGRRGWRLRDTGMDTPLDGFWAVIRHWKLELYMAIFGVVTGTVPGFGAPVAAVAAYGQAAQFSKSDVEFGTGAIEGVIAPEATDSAAEGGGMLPLLSLGIPTHEQQAILLAAFVTIGIAPGPTMLSNHLPTVFSIIWIIVIASLAMMALGLLLARQFAKLSTIPVSLLVPLIMMISIIGSFAVNGTINDAITTIVVGIIGYFFWKYNYSRINLIIGLVLGPIIESNLHIATTLYGNEFFLKRPLSAVIMAGIVATVLAWGWRNIRGRQAEGASAQPGARRTWRMPTRTQLAEHSRSGQMVMAVLLLGVFIAIAVISRSYGALTGGDLGLVAMAAAVLAVLNIGRLLTFGAEHEIGAGEQLRRSRITKQATLAAAAAAPATIASGATAARGDVAVMAPAAGSAVLGTGGDDGVKAEAVPGEPGPATSDASAAATSPVVSPGKTIRSLGIVVGFLVLTLLVGIIPASGLGFGIYTKLVARKSLRYAAIAAVLTWLVTWLLFRFVVNEYVVYDGIWHGL